MIPQSDWYTDLQNEIQKATFTRRENKLFGITRFTKSAKWVDSFSVDCKVCSDVKSEMLDAARGIRNITGEGSMEYESLNDRVYHHLRKEHNLYPRAYYVALYSLFGMITGTLFGGLAGLLIDSISAAIQNNGLKNGLLIGWFLGLVIGQIIGKRKDNRIKKEGRQF